MIPNTCITSEWLFVQFTNFKQRLVTMSVSLHTRTGLHRLTIQHPEGSSIVSVKNDSIKSFWFCFIMVVVYEKLIFLVVCKHLGNVQQIFLGNSGKCYNIAHRKWPQSHVSQKYLWLSQSSLLKIEKSQCSSDLPSLKYINPMLFLLRISQIFAHN